MIKHMFVFGVVIPTIITIVFFVGFLICWFKFNMPRRLFSKSKNRHRKSKNAFSAHEINSTQKIVQYGQDEEEFENEKNSELGKDDHHSNKNKDDTNEDDDDDDDKDHHHGGGGGGVIQCISNQGSLYRSKYVITPSQIDYHYQHYQEENLKATSARDTDAGGDVPQLEDVGSYDGGRSRDMDCTMCALNTEGITNNGLIVSPSMELETDHHQQHHHQNHHNQDNQNLLSKSKGSKPNELLVQHTFHFPNVSHCDENPQHFRLEVGEVEEGGYNVSVESEEEEEDESDGDNENYGHFVPMSQVVQQQHKKSGKKRQYYKNYGCKPSKENSVQLASLTEHLTPLQEV